MTWNRQLDFSCFPFGTSVLLKQNLWLVCQNINLGPCLILANPHPCVIWAESMKSIKGTVQLTWTFGKATPLPTVSLIMFLLSSWTLSPSLIYMTNTSWWLFFEPFFKKSKMYVSPHKLQHEWQGKITLFHTMWQVNSWMYKLYTDSNKQRM